MSKKFAEYSKFDLSNVNKEVLKKWQDGDIFHKNPRRIPLICILRRTAFCKWYAGYSPRYCPFD